MVALDRHRNFPIPPIFFSCCGIIIFQELIVSKSLLYLQQTKWLPVVFMIILEGVLQDTQQIKNGLFPILKKCFMTMPNWCSSMRNYIRLLAVKDIYMYYGPSLIMSLGR